MTLSREAIVGISVGGAGLLVAVALLLYFFAGKEVSSRQRWLQDTQKRMLQQFSP